MLFLSAAGVNTSFASVCWCYLLPLLADNWNLTNSGRYRLVKTIGWRFRLIGLQQIDNKPN